MKVLKHKCQSKRCLFLAVLIFVSTHLSVLEAKEKPPKETDYANNPDVVFVVQRAGATNRDLGFVRKFLGLGVHVLGDIGSSRESSRLALTTFTARKHHLIEYDSCCQGGRAALLELIDRQVFLHNGSVPNPLKGNHNELSQDAIDVRNAIQSVKEKYLVDGFARLKPTLIVLVLNFKSPYASFRLLEDAVPDVKGIKEAGAWIATILIDSQPNRQPKLRDMGELLTQLADQQPTVVKKGTKTQNYLRKFRNFLRFHKEKDKVNEVRFRSNVIPKESEELEKEENLNKLPTAKRYYEGLSLLYAQTMSARITDGIVIRSFADLVEEKAKKLIERLLLNPMSWFGEAEVHTSCDRTKHLLERAIWSPGFYIDGKYPHGSDCKYQITARQGYFLNLEFDSFSTEDIFDPVYVYDGTEVDLDQLLVSFSGNLQNQQPPPQVNSTEETMLVVFMSDGGNNELGFHATWTPMLMYDRLGDADVVFLVDVSGSINKDDIQEASRWVKQMTKFFYFNTGEDTPRAPDTEPSDFGILSFDTDPKILSDITDTEKSRDEFFASVSKLNTTMRSTYIGKAMDFARLQQFYKMRSENEEDIEDNEIPRKVLFVLSDGNSVDDPSFPAKRNCEEGIINVFIGFGNPSIRAHKEVAGYCGLSFDITTPKTEIIAALKKVFGVTPTETTTSGPHKLPETPALPTRAPTTTTRRTTTTTPPTTPTTTTTVSTTTVDNRLKIVPPPKFNYAGLAILLIVIGFIEVCCLIALVWIYLEDQRQIGTRPSDSAYNFYEKRENIFDLPTAKNSFFTRKRKEMTDFNDM